ncbi:hypothetical protein CRUP_017691 [Coryphaenoides rupestris]|nr:hypothetical protein CRUP_017691 [Coryphaenoides rupestris]
MSNRSMADENPTEYCSDNEDLFCGYDSILGDSSLMAKLDCVEQTARRDDHSPSQAVDVCGPVERPQTGGFTELRSLKKQSLAQRPGDDHHLTDSILDVFKDESFEELPAVATQLHFNEDVVENIKSCGLLRGDKTSTPLRTKESSRDDRTKMLSVIKNSTEGHAKRPSPKARRSMTDHLKRTMLSNAGAPSSVSCTKMLKEAVVTEEISVAMQAMETVSTATTDLGPFFAGFGLELDFMVEEYAGSKGRFPPVKRRNHRSLYVATIEKAHSLINSLIEAGRLDNVGLVVVDELHMLGDGSRGAIIEMTLSKVLYMSKQTQIIGMSATLGNIKDIQRFLRAENYTNDFRPLSEYVKLGDTIYEVDPHEEDCLKFSRLLNFKYSSSMQRMDPDHIIALVTEVIPSYSCLVFCPTQKTCENVAGMICKYLKDGNGVLCPVLRKVIPYGVAYHHGGLTSGERRLVEDAYSSGVLCLLACTSTLAAGINLPARRVILRSPYVAADFLRRSQYKQMVGRAGRAGIDAVGESILIIQDKDRDMVRGRGLLHRCLNSAPPRTQNSKPT